MSHPARQQIRLAFSRRKVGVSLRCFERILCGWVVSLGLESVLALAIVRRSRFLLSFKVNVRRRCREGSDVSTGGMSSSSALKMTSFGAHLAAPCHSCERSRVALSPPVPRSVPTRLSWLKRGIWMHHVWIVALRVISRARPRRIESVVDQEKSPDA